MLDRLLDLRRELAIALLVGPGADGPATHEIRLGRLFARRDRVEADLAQHIPELAMETRLRSTGPDQVAEAMASGSVLLEFIRTQTLKQVCKPSDWAVARYIAFVVPAGDPGGLRMFDLGPAEPIDQLIDDFLRSVRSEIGIRGEAAPDGGTRFGQTVGRAFAFSPISATPMVDAGKRLREHIFDPIRAAIGVSQQLIVSPDGDLNRLPFEVLPSAERGQLVDTYCFSYLVCGRDVLRFTRPKPAVPGNPPLVIADPDFDLTASNPTHGAPAAGSPLAAVLRANALRFRPLPETGAEAQLVGEALRVSPRTRESATVAAVREAEAPRVVHFATHGFFLPDRLPSPTMEFLTTTPPEEGTALRLEFRPETGILNPLLRSGLALAGANTFLCGGRLPPDAGNGLLTAEDIVGLNLSETELVVMSACDTGVGVIRTGEGVYGLRRAFAVAGARTLVLSLWSVGDVAARELMAEFYSRLVHDKIPRAEALRQAMLALKIREPKPWYWGAFVCQGDPGPLCDPVRS